MTQSHSGNHLATARLTKNLMRTSTPIPSTGRRRNAYAQKFENDRMLRMHGREPYSRRSGLRLLHSRSKVSSEAVAPMWHGQPNTAQPLFVQDGVQRTLHRAREVSGSDGNEFHGK